eukprot:SAG11_NODE_21046_length_433_cov_0.772455_2_plen_61_part_00
MGSTDCIEILKKKKKEKKKEEISNCLDNNDGHLYVENEAKQNCGRKPQVVPNCLSMTPDL